MDRRRFFKWTLGTAAGIVAAGAAAAAAGWRFVHSEPFGVPPEAIPPFPSSPHFSGEAFHNTLPNTPLLNKGVLESMYETFVKTPERTKPSAPIPSVRADLQAFARGEDAFIWLGHSSFLLRLAGASILIDPVLSPAASPFSFLVRAFPGTTPYRPEDFPQIDLLLISHDHWDHLDFSTLSALRGRIARVVTPLGVGGHLERWGFSKSLLTEGDWGDGFRISESLTVHLTESRHFSGRGLKRNNTLWGGFLLESPARKILFSGDGGYGPHFAEIGRKFGGVDLALLDSGQYSKDWPNVHMTPEEAVLAGLDLGARAVVPAHNGKFSLSPHAWDDPFGRALAAGEGKPLNVLTPKIGEPVAIGNSYPRFDRWWEGVDALQKAPGA